MEISEMSEETLDCLDTVYEMGWTCITKGWSSDPNSIWYPLHQQGLIFTGPPPNNPGAEMVYLTPKGLEACDKRRNEENVQNRQN